MNYRFYCQINKKSMEKHSQKLNQPTKLEEIMYLKRFNNNELFELIKSACDDESLLTFLKKDYLAPVSHSKLSCLRTGKTSFYKCNAETIIKIAFALKIGADELLEMNNLFKVAKN